MVKVLFVGGEKSSTLLYNGPTLWNTRYYKVAREYDSLLECRKDVASTWCGSVGYSAYTKGKVYDAKTKKFLGFIDCNKWYFQKDGKWYWQFIVAGGKLDSYYGKWDIAKNPKTGFHYR